MTSVKATSINDSSKIVKSPLSELDVRFNMSNSLTRRHIVVSPRNYELIRDYGRASDSMNDAVTEVLRVAQGHKRH
jgi:hypothetical protein